MKSVVQVRVSRKWNAADEAFIYFTGMRLSVKIKVSVMFSRKPIAEFSHAICCPRYVAIFFFFPFFLQEKLSFALRANG